MPADPKANRSNSQKSSGRGGFTSFQDAINKETIRKEMQHHRTHVDYVDPPKRKTIVLTEKPNNIDMPHLLSSFDKTALLREVATTESSNWRKPTD
ncbi:hypothetical protein HDV05_000633, partial [Chytridiales sp. JEL 0842]